MVRCGRMPVDAFVAPAFALLKCETALQLHQHTLDEPVDLVAISKVAPDGPATLECPSQGG